ncbi:MAG: DUF1819 family protein [Bacteroidia bacterium]
MTINKYTFSFTAASSLIKETVIIGQLYLQYKDWGKVEEDIYKHNILNKSKRNTIKREFNEIRKRLKTLNESEMNLLVHGDTNSEKAMVHLALVKTYSLIYEFIHEVINSKFIQFEKQLTETDYSKFIDAKATLHPELEVSSETTLNKVKQVTFKMLAQIGIIDSLKEKNITKPFLDIKCIEVILNDNPTLLSAFLYSDEEIKSLKNMIKA